MASQENKNESSPNIIKILQYNVHGWATSEMKPNHVEVEKLILKLKPDIVSLNEAVWGEKKFVMAMASRLHMEALYSRAGGGQGNAILTKKPMEAKAKNRIKVGVIEMRSVASATVGGISFHSTHLDVSHESTRLKQLDMLLEHAQTMSSKHVLIGDFNTLNAADYAPDHLQQIQSHRTQNHWEPVHSSVYEKLIQSGYQDCLYQAETNSSQELVPASAKITKKTPVGAKNFQKPDFVHGLFKYNDLKEINFAPVSTCWANTRIDYIFLSPGLKARVLNYERISCFASDHFPVYVELQILSDDDTDQNKNKFE